MGIVNRRNAFVGWLAIKAGKHVAKKKATPSGKTGGIVAGTTAALATAAGLVLFWRKKSGGDSAS